MVGGPWPGSLPLRAWAEGCLLQHSVLCFLPTCSPPTSPHTSVFSQTPALLPSNLSHFLLLRNPLFSYEHLALQSKSVHRSQKVETTQVSIFSEWINEMQCIHTMEKGVFLQ